MSAIVVNDNNNKPIVLVAIIKNDIDMDEKDRKESQQCVNEFRRMMSFLNVYFQKYINEKNIKYMSVSIPTNVDCLKYMTTVMRSNVFNTLFEWLNYAETQAPNFDVKEIVQKNGINLTNFIAIIQKTPKTDVYSLYQGQKVYKEKFCSIDTAYGSGFENTFYKYILSRFPAMKTLMKNEISIKCVYISYFYPITTTFESQPEYSVFQFHFCNKTTYYLLMKGTEFQCEYILTSQIGRFNFV